MTYTVQSAVLLLNFNRPDLSLQVLQVLRSVKPSRLYFAADGPRADNPGDQLKCAQVKDLLKMVDWKCQKHALIQESNLGCKIAVSTAIEWFFEQESEGIILEDDCLPGIDFFFFCDSMLTYYRFDQRVFLITGTNLQDGIMRGEGSYYFSNFGNIWGWASWKRTWDMYDPELKGYKRNEALYCLENIFHDAYLIQVWLEIFDRLQAGRIDTWDQQLELILFFQNGLCITPNTNLISNIGFREDATHFNSNLHNSSLALGTLTEIKHQAYVIPDKAADFYLMNKEFKLDEKRLKDYKDKLLRRRIKQKIKSWFSEVFK